MPLSRRYTPEFAPGESCSFGFDFSPIIPVGVGVEQGTVRVLTNTAAPVDVTAQWTIGPVGVRGRAIYATFSGGVSGTDYQIKWTATDSAGNVWPRTAFVLCADTS
ncbi:MAG TPA: hypothetical protein VHT52_13955 [Stellaceae bacterium]|jgi:hypothetical protein|nr:hypothetical protein [Stellaceae bacterium]